ncbi:sensor histidine kinase [Amnibacterium kyonggiense]
MDIPDRLRWALVDPRLRLAFAVVVAFTWYVLAVSVEAGRDAAPVVVAGVPGVLVLVWWRTRPWLGLGLAAVALLLTLFTVGNGEPVNGGGLIVLMTAWFAVLGAALAPDARARWAALALVVLDAFLSLASNGVPSFVIVALFSALAYGIGWGWRQLQRSAGLQSRLVDTAQHAEDAERDVLLELERNRIAREVHDVVAHSLAVVIAQADGARFAAETRPAAVAPALEAIGDTARRALGEVRTMLHDLRVSGETGVVPGPEDLAGLVEGVRALGVEVDEAGFGDPRPLDRRTGLAIYRIAQEALTNAMRHGDRLEPVGFEVDWGEREVVLVVTNAVPEEALAATERAGHGITGIRERAADAGGDCSAGVGTNGRFRLRVALPIPSPVPAAEGTEDPQRNPLAALMAQLAEPRA